MIFNMEYSQFFIVLALMCATIIFGAILGILIFSSALYKKKSASDNLIESEALSVILDANVPTDLNRCIAQERNLALEFKMKAENCLGKKEQESYRKKCEGIAANHEEIATWLEELKVYKSPAFETDFKIRILDTYLLRAVNELTEANTYKGAAPIVTSMELPRLVNLLRTVADDIKYE